MDNWFDEAESIASQVARVVHRKYHTYFDVADVRQECIVWVLRREKKVREWLNPDQEPEAYKGGIRQLGKTLSRHADRYCRKRKAQSLGYAIEDEAYYSPVTLGELLPFVWNDVVDTAKPDGEKLPNVGNPAEGGNYVIQLIDIRHALAKLNEMDRDVLQLKFDDQLTFAQIAEELEVSDSTAHRKVADALRRLNNYLGGQSPFVQEVEME